MAAAQEIASALVLQGAERSTPHDALVYLGQSMAFAAACAVFPCYAAWCMGEVSHELGTAIYSGEDAAGGDPQAQPAVYREGCLPTESLYQEGHHIEHLAVAPCLQSRALEFGATFSVGIPPLWRSPYFVYALSAVVPSAFVGGSVFRLTTRAAVGYAAVALWYLVAWADALHKLYAYYDEHGTAEGGEELRAAVYGIALFGLVLLNVLPVFGSSHPMSVAVKCKAAGIILLQVIFSFVYNAVYQNVIFAEFFNQDEFWVKMLIRGVGTVI